MVESLVHRELLIILVQEEAEKQQQQQNDIQKSKVMTVK